MIIGSNKILIEELPSTNTYAASLLKSSSPSEGTIIYTHHQSAGRGYQDNKWESEKGKNLLFSIILYPDMIIPSEQFVISMALSLGICDFLGRYTSDYFIKWPNDIYCGNDKIAGILIENSVLGNTIESCIAGIGVNINQTIFISNAPNPVSLCQITGSSHDLSQCMNELAADLDKRYKEIIMKDSSIIMKEYIEKLYRINEWHKFSAGNCIFTGRILSVTKIGRLQIEKEEGSTEEYSFKEIEFIL